MYYFSNRYKPVMANTMPTVHAILNDSLKNKKPASTIGTAESGPPFWNSTKNRIVSTPTHTPVNADQPSGLNSDLFQAKAAR